LLNLISDILDLSKIESGTVTVDAEDVFVSSLLDAIARPFRHEAETRQLGFELHVDPKIAPIITTDAKRLQQVLKNLLSNAFKFTLDGSVSVVLREAGDQVELAVSDTGVGIPRAELRRVFERFHRIEGTRARTFEGSGIGLALVHELVAMHGGRIEVASEPDRGTCFTVTIPFGRAHLPAEHVSAPGPLPDAAAEAEPFVQEALRWVPDGDAGTPDEAEHREPEMAIGSPRKEARVLVADDNADMRQYVARLLCPHFAVETVADGVQALARARALPPDLILTDAMMPNLDGFGLLAELRRDPRTAGVPVIMLSARAGEEARIEGLSGGADDYLVKPFSGKELITRVSVHLENARVRRAAEDERNRFRGLLGQVPAIVNFLRGPDLVFEFVHPMAVQRFAGRQVLGRPLLEALPEFRDQEFPALLRRVMETGTPVTGHERPVRHLGEDGRLRESYWSFIYLPIAGEDGAVDGVMTFDVEVTEQVVARRKVEEQSAALTRATLEAERARQVAESANTAKDAFLAMLGHEMRNPLAPIRTSLQLLHMRGAKSRELAIIERQVDHLVRLVDDLLDISRITRGKIEIERAPLEFADAVAEGVEMTKPLLDLRGQTADVQVQKAGLPILGDRGRLAQVVANLVNNAAKFSPRGSTIRVSAARLGSEVRLRVRDPGVGMTPEMLERVFQPFVQETQTIERSRGGLGLGLAIVRSLIELHGGRVSAFSEGPGKGSELVVDLPLAPEGRAGAERPEVESPPSSFSVGPSVSPDSAQRVLVVDDNEDAREVLADALRELGYFVTTAPDGQAALEIARAMKPNVCLVDIGLPVMDGYELARHLRASKDLPDNARIVAISGYGQDADRQRSSAAGFNAHLVKPVTIDDVTRTLVN
jgi:signal transduction histidine kinase